MDFQKLEIMSNNGQIIDSNNLNHVKAGRTIHHRIDINDGVSNNSHTFICPIMVY